MTDDLHEMLESALHAGTNELSGATPGDGAVPGWVRTVRRRRTVRHVVRAAVAVPVLAALGAGVWFGLGEGFWDAPVATPTPSPTTAEPTPDVTPSPTPDPTPSGSPSPDETDDALVELDVPGLPPHFAAPEGLLEQTGPGWVVTIHRPLLHQGSGDALEVNVLAHTVLLHAPDGAAYRTVDLPEDVAAEVISWEAGSPRVRILTGTVETDEFGDVWTPPTGAGWLDLATGEITSDGVVPANSQYQGPGPEGSELWMSYGDGTELPELLVVADGEVLRTVSLFGELSELKVSPDRTRAAFWGLGDASGNTEFMLLDLTTGESTEVEYGLPGTTCAVIGWLDASRVLVNCFADRLHEGTMREAEPRLAVLDVDEPAGGAQVVHEFGTAGPVPTWWGHAVTVDGAVVFSVMSEEGTCAEAVLRWDGALTTLVPAAGELMVEGLSADDAGVFLETHEGCYGNGFRGNLGLSLVDPVSGAQRQIVAPLVADGGDSAWFAESMRSWAVAR